jgi:ribosome-associated protein
MREVDEDGLAIRPNKTQLKRELAELQKLVVDIVNLSEGDRSRLDLDEKFLGGIKRVQAMKASGSRNREIKYLTKYLQQSRNCEAVRQWFDTRNSKHSEENRHFHALEKWRDRLVDEGDPAFQQYLAEYPQTDRQQIRTLIRNAIKEKTSGKPAGAGKKLFRMLRENTADERSL